jgi:hypothetical protein
MVMRAADAPPAKQSGKATKAQLERILSSATFQQVDRLKRFLQFIVSEYVEGRGDELKEYVVGVQVFGKESTSIRAPTRSCAYRRGGCGRASIATTARKGSTTS